MVKILAFQASDPGSIPGYRIFFMHARTLMSTLRRSLPLSLGTFGADLTPHSLQSVPDPSPATQAASARPGWCVTPNPKMYRVCVLHFFCSTPAGPPQARHRSTTGPHRSSTSLLQSATGLPHHEHVCHISVVLSACVLDYMMCYTSTICNINIKYEVALTK